MGDAALIATDLMGMAIPWLIKGGIDVITREGESSWPLLKYPLLILAAASLQGIFRYFWRVNIFGFSHRVEWDLRGVVFSHLLKLPLSYFQHTKTGDLMSRLTNDMQAIRELLGRGSLAIIDSIVVISGSIGFMIAIDPSLTFWSLLFLPLTSLSVRFLGKRIFYWSRDAQPGMVGIIVGEPFTAGPAGLLKNVHGKEILSGVSLKTRAQVANFRKRAGERAAAEITGRDYPEAGKSLIDFQERSMSVPGL